MTVCPLVSEYLDSYFLQGDLRRRIGGSWSNEHSSRLFRFRRRVQHAEKGASEGREIAHAMALRAAESNYTIIAGDSADVSELV